MASELFMQRMTWPEIQVAIEAGMRTAVIVAGATEQHGPHLPTGTDEMLGEQMGSAVARVLGDALVAPVIRPGCSDRDLDFPGTISISRELLTNLLDAYVASLGRQGFTRFVVFSTHGGNFPVLDAWVARGVPDGVVVISTLGGFGARFARTSHPSLHHSDLMETSLMLATNPDLVHIERAEAGYVGPLTAESLRQHRMKDLSPNGVLGDPAGASAAIGREALGLISSFLVSKVDERSPSGD